MTVKELHANLRRRGAYTDNVNLKALADIFHTKLFIFDVCAVFMFVLKKEEFACRLLQWRLYEDCKLSSFLLSKAAPSLNL